MNMLKCSMWAMMVGLTACGGGGGGGSGVAGSQPDAGLSALNAVPEAYRAQVRQAKTWQFEMENEHSIFTAELFDKAYGNKDAEIDLSGLPLGLNDYPYKDTEKAKRPFTMDTVFGEQKLKTGDVVTTDGVFRVYQQPYSIVVGNYTTGLQLNDNPRKAWADADADFDITDILGLATTQEAVDALNIQATYRGEAFTAKDRGELGYQVDFQARNGSGEITGLDQFGRIALEKGNIAAMPEWLDMKNVVGISAAATSEKQGKAGYTLMFAGPKAEEISGMVQKYPDWQKQWDEGIIGFGGKR